VTFGQQEASKLRINKAVSPVVAIFNLGGGEVILILTLMHAEGLTTVIGRQVMPDMKSCLASAKEFSQAKIPDAMKQDGVTGLKADCKEVEA